MSFSIPRAFVWSLPGSEPHFCCLLKVVYTSWLSRAIETAWLVLDEMDSLWLPIVKSWRLNERM